MRFIHLADLHLGKVINDFPMTEDQRYFLKQVTETVRNEKIDAVLISGDIYDRAIPPESAVRLLDDFVYEIMQTGANLLVITGNHDSDERVNFGSRVFRERGIFIRTKLEKDMPPVTLEDEYGEVRFYLLPFIKASQVKSLYEEEYDSYDSAVRAVIDRMEVDTSTRNVILAHQFVVGRGPDESGKAGKESAEGQEDACTPGERAIDSVVEDVDKRDSAERVGVSGVELGGSESYTARHVGLVEQVYSDCFDAFDYAALGHIHRPQYLGRETVRYAGAPLRYHFDEIGQSKSVPIVTMKAKGETEVELRTFKPLHDMRSIKGPFSKLLEPENITDPEDYIFVTLTDRDIVPDAINIFRKYYPNVMQIRYDNSHTKELEAADLTEYESERSFDAIVSDFYKLIYNEEMSEEELSTMKQAAKTAGIMTEG